MVIVRRRENHEDGLLQPGHVEDLKRHGFSLPITDLDTPNADLTKFQQIQGIASSIQLIFYYQAKEKSQRKIAYSQQPRPEMDSDFCNSFSLKLRPIWSLVSWIGWGLTGTIMVPNGIVIHGSRLQGN